VPRRLEQALLVIGDLLAFNAAFAFIFALRFQSGIYRNDIQLFWTDFLSPALVMSLFWMGLFAFNGLYKVTRTISRSDELLNVIKYVTIGIFLLYLVTVDPEKPVTFGKSVLLFYGGALIVAVGTERIAIRTFHRYLLSKGRGLARTLIVGLNRRGRQLAQELLRSPLSGYKPVGFVAMEGEKPDNEPLPCVGIVSQLPELIRDHQVEEVILALDKDHHNRALDIMLLVGDSKVGLKSHPDLYEAISGLARTQQLYGVPLINLRPELMPGWEQAVKRLMDIVLSLILLVLFLPIEIIVAIAIKLDSPGPVFYLQERVGKNGRIFKVIKFRTMVHNAEKDTGPVWAGKNDPRITRVGRVLRFFRLDELPQFINVLKNEMSLVGPRPERPYFVEQIQKQLPLYNRRHRVKPGITGWAQVKHSYDTSLEDVRRKLKFDLFYLENMSLRLDLKIMIYTLYVMFTGKGSH